MVFIPENVANWRKRRSVLFMPASNPRALAKAPKLDCDAVIFDLEDAVHGSEQVSARQNLLELVKDRDFAGKETVVRISAWGETNCIDDLSVALQCGVDGVLLPKLEDVTVLQTVHAMISAAVENPPALWAMIETPQAIMNLEEISASGLLTGLVVGPNDLAKETGAIMAPGREMMLPWMMMVVAAARSNNLFALDGVYNNFNDLDGLSVECRQGAGMGFDGKTLIHPKQIEIANAAFAPNTDELARARRIIEVFDQPENMQKGAVQLDGEMVERLHLAMAEKLVGAYGPIDKPARQENGQ